MNIKSVVFLFGIAIAAVTGLEGQTTAQLTSPPVLKVRHWAKPKLGAQNGASRPNFATSAAAPSWNKTLPLWTFFVKSSRDGNPYGGVMVGRSPFLGGGSVSVPTYVVPVVFNTAMIGTGIDPTTGAITTVPGNTTFDPTAADDSCLGKPNDVPLNLVLQSPILRTATFDFGGTIVGNTQYVDAFQRVNFWNANDGGQEDYHVLLGPVKALPPLVLNVPAAAGLALPGHLCSPLGIIDVNWFDNYLESTALPALAKYGVGASDLPIFLMHNTAMALSVTDANSCCILGYHGTSSNPPIQTYAPVDFDTTGIFGPSAEDTSVLSHEVAEWVNDPFGDNPTPAWGNTGQVLGTCQNNLEVGDPLSGTMAPPIVMPNGFTYHLQELAFFSWFYGAPSVGLHGWYSNNGTFLTDAGPTCTSQTP